MSKAPAKRVDDRDDDKNAKSVAANHSDGDNIRNEPTKDLQANVSQANAKGEYAPAKAAHDALNDLGEAINEIERSDRKARDLFAIRDVRDEIKAVLQRIEQFVTAP